MQPILAKIDFVSRLPYCTDLAAGADVEADVDGGVEGVGLRDLDVAVPGSATNRFISSTTGFHNNGEGPY